MSDDAPELERNPIPRLLVAVGLAIAAVAIAFAVFLYNGDTAASECPVQKDKAAAIDAAAVGELAAVNPTGEGRGFSTLSFEDEAGKPKTIKDFAGKMLVVNFWATWCVPCRAEMPELDAVAATYDSDTFMVLPINLDIGDEGVRKAKAFLADGGWAHLPLYADPSFQAFERLKTEAVAIGLPATLILDAKGCELAVLQGPAEWNSPDGHKLVEALIGLKT
jgi:thiol-disulfide isomerase/thioredoxin